MSQFKFNFSGIENSSEDQIQDNAKVDNILWLESKVVLPGDQIKNLDNIVHHAKMFTYQDIEIGHISASDALLFMKDLSNVELAEKEHSDLIAGKYEGGLKIWECTVDLIQYLVDNDDKISFKDAKVLDLGCGAGLLGIYAHMKGAKVTFQDYNKDVLEAITIPNVLLNIEEDQRDSEITKCKYYSGDWASFNETLPEDEVYNFILTSETIYNVDNYKKLVELFSKRLCKDGKIYVAAKTCYFGVGGGTRQFESSVSNIFDIQLCWKSTDGIQREILELTFQ